MKQNLTEGSIPRKLMLYFLPIAAGTLFQQLYNAADAIIVGKFVGTVALAAVGGSSSHITNLLIGFFVSLSGGCTVIIAQLFGAKDSDRVRSATGTAVAFCLITGVVLTVLGVVLTPWMLRVLRTPENTLADSAVYLRIVFLGVSAQLLYNIGAGILRAVGDSRSPFFYLLICCMTNIVLDLLFVVVFGMGVAGVAIATVISQLISAVLSTVKLARCREAYRITLSGIRIERRLLRRMMYIGVPAALQASMYSVSNLILQVAVNLLGTTTVAAWSLSGKFDGVYWACSNAAGIAVMNFAAQNYGAGRIDRVKESERFSLRLFLLITLVFSAALFFLAPVALPLFTDDPAVVAVTVDIIDRIVPFYFTWTFIEIISGVLRGMGDAVIPTVICGTGICLLRVLWVVIVCPLFPGVGCICFSYAVSWAITGTALLLYFRFGRWQSRLTDPTAL